MSRGVLGAAHAWRLAGGLLSLALGLASIGGLAGGGCVPASHALADPEGAAGCDGGLCGVACDGGACPVECHSDACRPQVLTHLPDSFSPAVLTVSAQTLFVCSNHTLDSPQQVDLPDGRLEGFGQFTGVCSSLDDDPGQGRLLWVIAENNGGTTGIASQDHGSLQSAWLVKADHPVAVKVRGEEVLWSGQDGLTAGLFVVRDGVSSPVAGMVGTTRPGTIALGPDGRIFVAWPEVRDITSALDTTGAGARLLVDGQRTDHDPLEPLALAVSGQHLYFGMDSALWRVAVDGATPAERILEGQPRIVSLVADESAVYWLEASSGALYRLTIGSSRFEVLAAGLQQPTALGLDPSHLYWLEPPAQALMVLNR